MSRRRGGRRGRAALVAFDLDGVLYRGSAVLPGAREAVEHVLETGRTVRYVTNNSTLHRRDVAAKLTDLGVPAEPEQVLTSAAAATAWLARRIPEASRILVVGETGLLGELEEAGFTAIHAGAAAVLDVDYAAGVVVGLDRRFDYAGLDAAQQVLLRGGFFVATNDDDTYPTEGGTRPGAGAMVAAVRAAGGVEPVIIGKPHPGLAEALVASTGIGAEDTVFVGDRLETDIAFARRAGMISVLVLTGVNSRDDLGPATPPEQVPDLVLEDLTSFGAALEEFLQT